MIVGILQLELDIPGAESLKDKRSVVKSLKDRLHREHLVSIAEIGRLQSMGSALLGIACVGHDQRRIGETLDTCIHKARQRTDCEVVSTARWVSPMDSMLRESGSLDRDVLADEMLARAAEPSAFQPDPVTEGEMEADETRRVREQSA